MGKPNPLADAFSAIFTGEPLSPTSGALFLSILAGAHQRRVIQREITPDNAWVVGAHGPVDFPEVGIVGESMIAIAPPVVGHPLSPQLRMAVYALASALNDAGTPAVNIPVGMAAELLATVLWAAGRTADAEILREWAQDTDAWQWTEPPAASDDTDGGAE